MSEQQRVEKEEKILPPEASRSGKNTVYIGCDVRHARQSYGVCLHIIKAYDEDRLSQDMRDCARAIAGNYCPAAKMRDEEKAAGRALYYKEREVKVKVVEQNKDMMRNGNVDKSSPSYIRGWNAVGGAAKRAVPVTSTNKTTKRPVAKVTTKAKAKPKSEFERGLAAGANDMSETINQAVKSEASARPKASEPKTDTSADARIKRAQRIAQMMKGKQNAK